MSLLRQLDLTPNGPAVNVIFFKEFLRVRPDFFEVVNRQTHQFFRHDPARVLVCDQSESRAALFPESMGHILKVTNENELERLTEKMLRLPLFFTIDLKRMHKSGNTRYINTDEAAVIVNSQHPYIQDHYRGLLTEAMDLMREGKKFAVELDFNGVLEDWLLAHYRAMGQGGSFNTVYRSRLGRVAVTNHGEYSQVFSCDNCPTVGYWWTACFPCCLVACPIYVLQRKLRVVDLGGRVKGVQATTFTSNLTRREVEGQFIAAAANLLLQQRHNAQRQAVVTQPPQPGPPPSYTPTPPYTPTPQGLPPPQGQLQLQGQLQPQGGPQEVPAQIVYGNPTPRVV